MLTRRSATTALLLGLPLMPVRAANIPRKSPEFAIDMGGGKELRLSSQKGKVVALVFILTYCPHCQKTVNILSRLQTEYGPRGFQVLCSAIEKMAATALPDFMRRFNPPFPVGFNGREEANDYLQHPVMVSMIMPRVAFIDRSFTIRAQVGGNDEKYFDDAALEKNLRADIEKLLREDAPAPQRRKGRKKTG